MTMGMGIEQILRTRLHVMWRASHSEPVLLHVTLIRILLLQQYLPGTHKLQRAQLLVIMILSRPKDMQQMILVRQIRPVHYAMIFPMLWLCLTWHLLIILIFLNSASHATNHMKNMTLLLDVLYVTIRTCTISSSSRATRVLTLPASMQWRAVTAMRMHPLHQAWDWMHPLCPRTNTVVMRMRGRYGAITGPAKTRLQLQAETN